MREIELIIACSLIVPCLMLSGWADKQTVVEVNIPASVELRNLDFSKEELNFVAPDILLKFTSDHVASHLTDAQGHIGSLHQVWVSEKRNVKIYADVSVFRDENSLVAAVNEWRKTSNMFPAPPKISTSKEDSSLDGNVYHRVVVSPLRPTIETNTKPFEIELQAALRRMQLRKLIDSTKRKKNP